MKRAILSLLILAAALPAMAFAADPPKKILDLLAQVETDRAAIAEKQAAIKADEAKLSSDTKARDEAVAAAAQHRAAFRAAWAEVYGDDEDNAPLPKPKPKPQPPIPTPQPPPTPAPTPKPVAQTAQWAIVFEDVDKREPWQTAVDVWAEEKLGHGEDTHYLRYDVTALTKEAAPEALKKFLPIIEGKPLPCLVIVGKSGDKENVILYVGAQPKTVEAFSELWAKHGGKL